MAENDDIDVAPPGLSCSSIMEAEKGAREAIRAVVATLPNIQKLEQEQSLLSFVSGHDVVSLLPTGFGKGLIFQLAQLVVKELAKTNTSDWLWQIQSGSGQIQ